MPYIYIYILIYVYIYIYILIYIYIYIYIFNYVKENHNLSIQALTCINSKVFRPKENKPAKLLWRYWTICHVANSRNSSKSLLKIHTSPF